MSLEFIVDEMHKRCHSLEGIDCDECVACINGNCAINYLNDIISKLNKNVNETSSLINRG